MTFDIDYGTWKNMKWENRRKVDHFVKIQLTQFISKIYLVPSSSKYCDRYLRQSLCPQGVHNIFVWMWAGEWFQITILSSTIIS